MIQITIDFFGQITVYCFGKSKTIFYEKREIIDGFMDLEFDYLLDIAYSEINGVEKSTKLPVSMIIDEMNRRIMRRLEFKAKRKLDRIDYYNRLDGSLFNNKESYIDLIDMTDLIMEGVKGVSFHEGLDPFKVLDRLVGELKGQYSLHKKQHKNI